MQGLRILHLATDEKFIDQAFRTFEQEAPNCNSLVVCGKVPLKHVKTEATIVHQFEAFSGIISKSLPQYDIVIIHSLNQNWFRTITRLNDSAVLIWLGWGYDYYDIIKGDISELLLPLTRDYFNSTLQKKDFTGKLKSIFRSLVTPDKASIIEKIDIFCPVLPSEHDATRTKFVGEKFPRQGLWNYGDLEGDMIKGFEDQVVSGNNLLIGNSASIENNHLDSFELIAQAGTDDRKIISPLSYGDTQYRGIVMDAGLKIFGENFKPLIDFMPMKEYVATLQSCGFVIMNHLRQQAVGNIVIMLYLGAKIFLHKDCPTYSFLKDLGAVVFSTDELQASPSMLNQRLDEKSIIINRQVLHMTWSREVRLQKTRDLLSFAASTKR